MTFAEHRATMHRLGLIGALALAGCALKAPAVSAPVVETTEAGSAAPVAEIASPPPADATDGDLAPVACPQPRPNETRWLDSNPGAPLGVTYANALHPVSVACCAPWAKSGSRLHTIDPQWAVVF